MTRQTPTSEKTIRLSDFRTAFFLYEKEKQHSFSHIKEKIILFLKNM